MARPVQDRDREVGHADVAREGDPAQVVRERVLEVQRDPGRGAGHDLFHVPDRRKVREAAGLHRHQDRNRPRQPTRHERSSLDRIHRQVELPAAQRYRLANCNTAEEWAGQSSGPA